MPNRDDALRFLEFLSVLAGLIGIVVSVNQFQLSSVPPTTIRAYFSVILVVFLFTSALTFLRALQGKDISGMNMGSPWILLDTSRNLSWTISSHSLSLRLSDRGILDYGSHSLNSFLLGSADVAKDYQVEHKGPIPI